MNVPIFYLSPHPDRVNDKRSLCKVTKPTVSIYMSLSYLSCYIEVAIVTGIAVIVSVLRNVM